MVIDKTVTIEVELEDFGDDAIVEYLEAGGYKVTYGNSDIEDAVWFIARGDLESAALALERNNSALKGLVDLIKKKTA